jgi:CheY-like chemotaxis protein/HPt (histidine-containing phosphotransfer) domain-containing protein
MPDMDGLETSRRISTMDGMGRKPEIIMISAYDLSELVDEISQIGIKKRLTKLVTESHLFDAVMDVFGAIKEKPLAFGRFGQEGLIAERFADIKGSKILLVEDNEINQQVAQEILQQAGFEVDIAANGLQALEALEKDEYDIVLMDVQMPVMDGYEATRQIRSNLCLANLPIIAMTAHSMSGDREKSLNAGMNDHVTKPIDPAEVLAALVKWIKPCSRSTSGTDKYKSEVDNADDLPWPGIPGIALADGLTRVGGNRKLYKKLLGQFRASNIDTVGNIQAALSNGDDKSAARLAHTVKGVAANLGADHLEAVGAELETALKQKRLADIDVLLTKFSAELTIVTEGIRAFEEALASPETEPQDKVSTAVDVAMVRPILVNLAQMLESGMVESMEQISALESQLSHSKVAKQFQQLKQDVDIFDMDSALANLKAIATTLEISLQED